jgi:hypothetical protein
MIIYQFSEDFFGAKNFITNFGSKGLVIHLLH